MMNMMFHGIPIIASEYATEEVPLFPDAKRTKRGLRRRMAKYGKRFPGLKKRVPCAFMFQGKMIAHPAVYQAVMLRGITS